MNLDKDSVKYLHDQPCFTCGYSQIDQSDFGLCCTLFEKCCPNEPCKYYTNGHVCTECFWRQIDFLIGAKCCRHSDSPFYGRCWPVRTCEYYREKLQTTTDEEEWDKYISFVNQLMADLKESYTGFDEKKGE